MILINNPIVHPYNLAKAALFEVGMGHLFKDQNLSGSYPFSVTDPILDGRNHYFEKHPGYNMVHLGYFPQNYDLEQLAFIERSMYIGLSGFNIRYSCGSCESRFKSIGIHHTPGSRKFM